MLGGCIFVIVDGNFNVFGLWVVILIFSDLVYFVKCLLIRILRSLLVFRCRFVRIIVLLNFLLVLKVVKINNNGLIKFFFKIYFFKK